MMEHYTDDEKVRLVRESANVQLAWIEFVKHVPDLQPIHPPPALHAMVNEIIDHTMPDLSPEDRSFITCMLARMFEFGQFSIKRGLICDNLLPCKCGEATDQGLRELLDGR